MILCFSETFHISRFSTISRNPSFFKDIRDPKCLIFKVEPWRNYAPVFELESFLVHHAIKTCPEIRDYSVSIALK